MSLGLSADRATSPPAHYTVDPGNLHASKLFEQILDTLFGVTPGFTDKNKTLTVVFHKGLNSKENLALSCLGILELKVGGPETAKTLEEESAGLNSVLNRYKGSALPSLQIEEPKDIQTGLPAALGYTIKDGSAPRLQNRFIT